VVLAACAPSVFAQARGLILKKDGGRVAGLIRWQPASRKYMVSGRGGVTWQVALRDVREVRVDKPVDFDRAVRAVQLKSYTTARPILEKIMKNYRMLQWDLPAARYLAESYLRTGKADEAVRMCKRVLDSSPAAAGSASFAPIYWEALLETDQEMTLKDALSKAIESGNRALAAAAQIKRGDIERKNNKLQNALIDGYLRTVLLFRDIKALRPEALYKTVLCFKELGRHSDAERWRKRLAVEFPQSPYIEKLRLAQ
jgi:tetratricopeptide (TPR) repeat protein